MAKTRKSKAVSARWAKSKEEVKKKPNKKTQILKLKNKVNAAAILNKKQSRNKNKNDFENKKIGNQNSLNVQSKCEKCSKIFSDDVQLADHLKREHQIICFKCLRCDKEFVKKAYLERHLYTACVNQTKTLYACSHCRRSFTRQDNLKQHIKTAHSSIQDASVEGREKKYRCEVCEKMFYTPSHLLIHERIHSGERPFQCDHCPKSFTNNGALKKHTRIHTGEKPFKCPHCDLSFSLKGTLNRHVKIHTGQKPHKCEYCGKEFIQSGGLKAHLFFHTGKNGFKCEHCDRQFNRKARLEMHKKYVHEKVKPFNCPACGKGFTRKEDLTRHLVLHTGIKSFECVYCKKSFAIKASLNVHLLTHRKEDPQPCKQCGHEFIRRDCLVRHIRKAHRENLEDLLYQHGLVDTIERKTDDSSEDDVSGVSFEKYLINGKLQNEKLCEAIRELLLFVVDHKLLKSFGWPNKPVDSMLESLIKQCNYSPVRPEDYEYHDRLRENVKLLFTRVIEDDTLKETLNNKTVDELIVNVINEAKSN